MSALELTVEDMEEDTDTQRRFHMRNKHVLSKLANSNRMLTGSLEALQDVSLGPTADAGGGGPSALYRT